MSIHVWTSLDYYTTDEVHSSSSWFSKTRVTTDHIMGVLGGNVVVCKIIQHCQTWSMPHITLIKQWDSISIHVLSSLDYYTIDEVQCSRSWVWNQGNCWSCLGYRWKLYSDLWADPPPLDVGHDHISLIKQCSSTSIHILSPLDHYSTDEIHHSRSWVWKPG